MKKTIKATANVTDNWTISLDDGAPSGAAPTWGVFCNGRQVLSGYASAKDARWAMEYVEAGELPPYVPAMHATPRRFERRKRERGADAKARPDSARLDAGKRR